MPKNQPLRIASLFSGAGGLDLGFERAVNGAAFHVVWANEYDKTITPTFRALRTLLLTTWMMVNTVCFHPPDH
jgi:site-specific DNA-cytosine methylase